MKKNENILRDMKSFRLVSRKKKNEKIFDDMNYRQVKAGMIKLSHKKLT